MSRYSDKARLVERNRTLHIYLNSVPVFLKFPSEQGVVGKPRTDASKPVEVGRNDWRAVNAQEVRRSDDGITALSTEWHGDHIVRHQIGRPQTEVKPGCNDVDQPPLGNQINVHLWVAL